MAYEDLTPSNRFELALSGDMTAEEASNRIEQILAGADIEPSNRLEYFLKLRVSEGGGGGETADYADQDQPVAVINSDITAFKRENGRYAFYNRAGISEINLPELTMFGAGTFSHAIGAEHIYVPKANIAGYSNTAFEYCTSLKELALPAATGNVYNAFFQECSNLEAVDLAISGFQQGDHFKNCAKLSVVVLRNSSAVSLSGVGTFTGTPFASGGTGGTLYVPQALISQYEAESNWSTILGYANNQIKAIEGSIYETQYVDGTPIS